MKTERHFTIIAPTADAIEHVVRITSAAGLSRWTHDDYSLELERKDAIFRVATDSASSIVGFILGRIIPSSSSDIGTEAEIYNIGVSHLFRRRGIGTALLREFLRIAKQDRCDAVWLEVRSLNSEAILFYEQEGFEASGERRNYYFDPPDDAVLMRLANLPNLPRRLTSA